MIHLLVNRPDSLLLSPPQRFDGKLLDFGRAKRSELREHAGHYFRYLVYIDPGIRYLVLEDIMIYKQF